MVATARRRLLLCLACSLFAVAQLALDAPVARAEPSLPPRVTLAGTTTIVGSTSGVVDVTVPARITLTERHATHDVAGPNADVRFVKRGTTPFFGFALVEDPFPEVRDYGRFLTGGQFALCERPPCGAAGTYNDFWSTLHEKGRAVLEPGNYKLLLIGEGPMEIRLRLHGLKGRTTVRPEPAEFAQIETPVATSHPVGSGELWWGGSTAFGGQVGFSLSLGAAYGREFGGGEFGVCQYNVLEPPPEQVGYGPHCQAVAGWATSGAHFTRPATGEDEEFVFSTSIGYHANESGSTIGLPNLDGDHGMGVWARVDSKLDYLKFATVFVALDNLYD